MKQKKNSNGTMVIFLETDLQKVLPFDENNFTQGQKQVFAQLSTTEQEKIRAGYGTVIANLENKDTICKFNMENHQPTHSAINSFARMLLPKIQEYYSHEGNRRKFVEDQAQKGKEK